KGRSPWTFADAARRSTWSACRSTSGSASPAGPRPVPAGAPVADLACGPPLPPGTICRWGGCGPRRRPAPRGRGRAQRTGAGTGGVPWRSAEAAGRSRGSASRATAGRAGPAGPRPVPAGAPVADLACGPPLSPGTICRWVGCGPRRRPALRGRGRAQRTGAVPVDSTDPPGESKLSVPAELSYTNEHEWVAVNEGIATVGITKYAAEALGDIVFVEPPETGATVSAGDTCGEIESTKSVSDVYAPVDGEVVEVNQAAV